MFFDDQIVKRVKDNYPKTQKAAGNLVASIIDSFVSKFKSDLKKGPTTEKYCRTCTKKIINLWNSAARKLIKDGYPLLKVDAIREILQKYVLPEEYKHFAE